MDLFGMNRRFIGFNGNWYVVMDPLLLFEFENYAWYWTKILNDDLLKTMGICKQKHIEFFGSYNIVMWDKDRFLSEYVYSGNENKRVLQRPCVCKSKSMNTKLHGGFIDEIRSYIVSTIEYNMKVPNRIMSWLQEIYNTNKSSLLQHQIKSRQD